MSQRGFRLLQFVVLAAPATFIAAAGWWRRWVFEDGFIYFRVVGNLNSGNGLGFNPGERVEAATGTLWVALLSATDLLLPLPLEWIAVLLGLLGTTAGVSLATLAGVRLARAANADGLLVPVGMAVFVGVLPTWVWATSGLETGLVFLWLAASWWVLAQWATTGDDTIDLWKAVVLGLGWLVRPELVLVSAVSLVVLVTFAWRNGRRRHAVAIVGAMVTIPVAYQIFRMGYFGLLVPNTALAKEGMGSNWSRGWSYLRDFVDQYWLWVPLLGLTLGGAVPLLNRFVRLGLRRCTLVMVMYLGMGLVLAIYVVQVGGDYLHGRMLLPSLFMLCCATSVVPFQRRYLPAVAVFAWVVVSIVAFRPLQFTQPTLGAVALPDHAGIVELKDAGFTFLDGLPVADLYREQALLSYAAVDSAQVVSRLPKPVIVAGAIGMVSYANPDAFVVDSFGLAHPLGAHLEIDPTRDALAGHEKKLPAAWIAAEVIQPDTPIAPVKLTIFSTELPADPRFPADVQTARSVLTCEPVQRRLAAAQAPLTPRQFLSNLVHAPANSGLRIPLDPNVALRELC